MIPEFVELLDKMKVIHEKKNQDYSAKDVPFENFERSSMLASWFNNDVDKAFVVLIGTKLARLATLLNSNAQPNNESIEDSFLDLTTYCALWSSYHSHNKIRVYKPTSDMLCSHPPGDRIVDLTTNKTICFLCKTVLS